MTHALKCDAPFFDAVATGRKNFEIRKQDRDFKVDDKILLQEFVVDAETEKGKYTGREHELVITDVFSDQPKMGLKQNFCIISFRSIVQKESATDFVP